MAVPEQTPYIEYTGNGVTNNFALEFTCDSKQELKVFIDNVEPELSTWSLVGGSVVFTTAPVSGSKIVLKRATKLERTTNYSSVNNSFRPDAINKDFDRVWYALQDQAYKFGQYDLDYSYAINTSNQALGNAATAQQKADSAYNLADTTNTETRPIERGGTGATTAAGARTNIGVYSQAEVDALVATGGQGNIVGVSGGGTGASTSAGARTNLDVYSKTEASDLFIENTEKGTPNGIAPLDENVKVDPIYISNLNEALFNQTNFPNLVPILFAPIPYPKQAAPAGFLLMNGQAITQAQYPILYSLYGANLPDLRGSFIRGLDNGKGYDAGRGILTYQADELKSHTHSVARAQNSGVGALTDRVTTANGDGGTANNAAQATGGTETRPKNIAFNYIVRAG